MVLSVKELVAKTGELPTMPHVATKVMQMLGDPETSAKDLQKVILTEPSMTLQILKIANSAMFGLRREVKTLTHAIMILGFSSIRSIVLAAATKNIYVKKGRTNFVDKLLWENSISCAMLARALAEKSEVVEKEEAFIGGLSFNLGKVVLNNKLGDKYTSLMQHAYNDDIPIEKLEKEELGFDNTEVNFHILQKWNLSENLSFAVRYYLDPNLTPESGRMLAAIIGLAYLMCKEEGIGFSAPSDVTIEAYTPYMQILGIGPNIWDKVKESMILKLKADSDMVASL